jgi:heme exporter protein C
MSKTPRLLWIIDVVSLVLLVAATLMVFIYAPIEAVMGPVQKVFYFHVANAWLGMLAFLTAVFAGIMYLVKKTPIWDLVGLSSIEIGLVFMLITIVTGSIWARPIWNTWWTWDPRLTTVTIMELVYAAYLMLRAGIEDPERRARFSAVYAIIGSLSVPLTFLSIRIFRTIHPVVIGSSDPNAQGAFSMTPAMGLTFAAALVAYSVLFISLLWHRIRLGELQEEVERQKMRLLQ